MTPVDEKLIEDADHYGAAMMSALGDLEGEHEALDARSVAIACAGVAGSFVFGISNPELKRECVRHWAETFFELAGVSFRIVDEN